MTRFWLVCTFLVVPSLAFAQSDPADQTEDAVDAEPSSEDGPARAPAPASDSPSRAPVADETPSAPAAPSPPLAECPANARCVPDGVLLTALLSLEGALLDGSGEGRRGPPSPYSSSAR